MLVSINPATGKPLGEAPICGPEEVAEAVRRARAAQPAWAARSVRDRARDIRAFRNVIIRRRMEIAEWITAEVGKPLFESLVQEILVAAELAHFYARVAPRVLRPRRVRHRLFKQKRSWIVREPKGVVGVITPWNYPFLLTVAPALAALVAGNTVVAKPSEHTPLIGLRIAKLFRAAGIPEDVFQVVTGDGTTGAALVAADVDHICFTGSVRTGRRVAARCGERLVSCTLELGGKDAAIVLEDAPLERTAAGIVWAAFANAGQVCAAIETVYAVDAIYAPLVQRLRAWIERLRIGPGTVDVDIGPMAVAFQRDIVEDHVRDAQQRGARVITGGVLQAEGPLYCRPRLVLDVPEDARVLTEETFGPVLPVVRVASAEEAIARIQASPYGLTVSIWTRDTRRAMVLARRIRVGSVYINDHLAPQGAPEVPWGGEKHSGIGRTRGIEGLLEVTYPKHIAVERWNLRRDPIWFPYHCRMLRWVHRWMPWLFRF